MANFDIIIHVALSFMCGLSQYQYHVYFARLSSWISRFNEGHNELFVKLLTLQLLIIFQCKGRHLFKLLPAEKNVSRPASEDVRAPKHHKGEYLHNAIKKFILFCITRCEWCKSLARARRYDDGIVEISSQFVCKISLHMTILMTEVTKTFVPRTLSTIDDGGTIGNATCDAIWNTNEFSIYC